MKTDAAEGPGITVYPSVLKLVCIQLYDMHVAATVICIQPGWQHRHALGHPFAAPLPPLPPPPGHPFLPSMSPVFLAPCPPDALPFVSPSKQTCLVRHTFRVYKHLQQKQYLSSLTVNGCFTDKLVWWFQSKSKGKSRFAPAGSAGEGEEEDSPNSRKPLHPDLHAWSSFESVNWLSMAPCPVEAH